MKQKDRNLTWADVDRLGPSAKAQVLAQLGGPPVRAQKRAAPKPRARKRVKRRSCHWWVPSPRSNTFNLFVLLVTLLVVWCVV